MSLHLVTAPTVLPVGLNEMKDHLRIEPTDTDEDALIMGLIHAGVTHIDGQKGILGRALCTQTWDYKLDAFPAEIRIPLPPLQSVDSISYVDENGATQTLSTSVYQVVNNGTRPSTIVEAYNQSWPTTRCIPQAVTVRFTAGYLDNNSPADTRNGVPQPVKHALMLLGGHWYENRTPVEVGVSVSDVPMTVDALLAPYRVYGW